MSDPLSKHKRVDTSSAWPPPIKNLDETEDASSHLVRTVTSSSGSDFAIGVMLAVAIVVALAGISDWLSLKVVPQGYNLTQSQWTHEALIRALVFFACTILAILPLSAGYLIFRVRLPILCRGYLIGTIGSFALLISIVVVAIVSFGVTK